MRKLICIITISAASVIMADVAPTNTPAKTADTKEPSVLQRVGGFVIDYKTAKGKYSFVNCQKKVDTKLIRGMAEGLKGDFAWNFECVDGPDTITSTKQAIAEKSKQAALAATFFIDCDTMPMMTIAPEANVAVVNVRELLSDKPKAILLENRLIREAMRAFAMSLGAGYTSFEGIGVMQPISSAADLDRLSANFMPPDSASAALRNGTTIGFKPFRRTTYKRACKEGWAPPPTNDFQRAVWEKVHAIPDKPITIEYDPKKDK